MASPTVLIIGCGVAGPVLAILLKRKGYNPIVFEKVRELGNAGASLMIMSNGLKVLDLIGLADRVKAESLPLASLWDGKSTGEALGQSNLPCTFAEKYRQPVIGIRRTTLNLMLKKKLIDLDIDVREGWGLIDIKEDEGSVTAFFNNDRSMTGSFLVGCDGIKSASRAIILKTKGITEGAPVFTGLTQTACISQTPEALRRTAARRNWYGDGIHVISYPVSPNLTSLAITQRETKEMQETWRPYQPDELPAQRERICELLRGWDPNILQMTRSAERIIKFGLFDRGELQSDHWYSRRCVLVGDAAHPTSPHLGQGANQALEDCYHLSQAMPSLTTESKDNEEALEILGKGVSESIFHPFAGKRQPRTSMLVRGARAQGERRVATGFERCEERNQAVIQAYEDNASSLAAEFSRLLGEPF